MARQAARKHKIRCLKSLAPAPLLDELVVLPHVNTAFQTTPFGSFHFILSNQLLMPLHCTVTHIHRSLHSFTSDYLLALAHIRLTFFNIVKAIL